MFLKFFLPIILLNSISVFAIDRSDIPEVFQREFIITNSDQHQEVQTYGLVSCIGLTIYDIRIKRGLLAHIDARITPNEIKKLFKNFSSTHHLIVELHSVKLNSKLLNKVQSYINILGHGFLEFLVKDNYESPLSISLNLATGSVSAYSEIISSTQATDFYGKIDRLKWGRKLFRHTSSIGGGDKVPRTSTQPIIPDFLN